MAGTVLKGTLRLDIDPIGLNVTLVFTPSKDGSEWNAEGLLKLLGEKRVSPLPLPRLLEETLQKAAKSKTTFSAVLCQGVPPEAPVPERVIWADLPVPEDLAEAVKELLVSAPPPSLYRLRVEKIKRETIVKKPGPLPFLPPKEEVVVTWDKRETKEAVTVDPELVDQLYAPAGSKVGTLSPPKPGKPGKSVFGKPIPPTMDGDPQFLLGEGLVRDKNEVRSTVSGLVRIGKNWADILPLAKPSWKVERGSDGATLYLYFKPGDRRFPLPPVSEIVEAAKALGATESSLVAPADIEGVMTRAIETHEEPPPFPLSLRVDGEARVDISSDRLQALLYMRKGVGGGLPLDLKKVSQVIRDARLKSFNAEQVKKDILDFFHGNTVELRDYVLAEGKSPTRGTDKEIKLLVQVLPEDKRSEFIQRIGVSLGKNLWADGERGFSIDTVTDAALVKKDAAVAQISSGSPGTDGLDVFGQVLPGLPGNDPELKLFDGLALRGTNLVAEKEGLLLLQREGNRCSGGVAEYRDALIQVTVSPDGMTAILTLEKELGAGLPLSAERINKALAEAGVQRGIDGLEVAEALRIAMERGNCPPRIVARGEGPVPKGGLALRWLINFAPQPVTLREDGRTDYKNQKRFVAVSEGQALAELVRQGSQGKEGFTVQGKTLAPEAEPQTAGPVADHDETIQEEPIDGGVRWIAARSGELRFEENHGTISSIHTVPGDVGLATGNLNFPGEIRIAGKISPGYTVVAGGDVIVQGVVEAALVSAGGRAVIGQGIIGAGKGIVRSRRTIDAAFVEQATLLAVEDIRVKNSCLLCNIKTNGKLFLVGEKGGLVGGLCRARMGVDAATVGSERGSRTEISFGQDYLVMDQIETTERETEKIKKALLELEKRLKQNITAPVPLEALRAEKVKLMKLLEKYGIRLFTLREKYEEHHAGEIRVRGTIFPGVVMESHGRYYEVTQKRSRVVFYFDRELGRIQEKPLTV